MKNCKSCQASFEVTDSDRSFYKKISPVINGKVFLIPEPEDCPDCRQKLRLVWRNEWSLYKRKCDLTGQSTVSFYHPNSPYTVYAKDVWWSDQWDGKQYGRDFDFSRPFFEQFNDLLHQVPHMSMVISHGENSDYAPYSVYYKNCYMCMSGVVGQDLYYCYWTNDSRDCMDCYACFRCEKSYECIQCINVYNSIYCKDCDNSSDLAFCQNLDGCKKCIGCYGLRHKEYYVFNQKVSAEEFEKLNAQIHSSWSELQKIRQRFQEHVQKYPQRALQMVNVENCTGDYLLNCRNSRNCYLSENLEDCAYTWNIPQGAKDCHDINYSPKAELSYNCMSATNGYDNICTINSWDNKNAYYTFECFYSGDLLGCAGLKREKFCILNRQYSEPDYRDLQQKVIEYMRSTSEWGEFFPPGLSPFAYNETIANDWFPLAKQDAEARGWKWQEETNQVAKMEKTISAGHLPDSIKEVPDDILNWAIECKKSGKPFKIIPQELKFYREHNLPIPHLSFVERHRVRLQEINPRRLYERRCDKCKKPIQTTFSSDRPEIVYCEECYLKEVY